MTRSQTARRALALRRRQSAAPTTPPATRKPRAAAVEWPPKITHAQLDELAERHGVEYASSSLTKEEKQAALTAAGITPEG